MLDSFQVSCIRRYRETLPPETVEFLDRAVAEIVRVKESGGKIVVATGSGPNLHEGITTLAAELIRKGVVDGITTSSAVVAHEMAGVLDRVKRIESSEHGIDQRILPQGGIFELSLIDEGQMEEVGRDLELDREMIERLRRIPGTGIIKAAGNMGYPMGPWIERLSEKIMEACRPGKIPFEEAVGGAADGRTMLGAAKRKGVPVLVSIPQMVGGGMVGLAIGDSIPVRDRSRRIAELLASADLIIESAVALTQEIHDGPFETYTGHGIWSAWREEFSWSLKGKKLIRIDLDPNLQAAWNRQRRDGTVQQAIDQGLPKTKLLNVPFRMEMSGFARLEGSLPVCADIGVAWPLMALESTRRLGVDLDFISFPQESESGREMRDWIVDEIKPIDRYKITGIDD